MDVLGFCVLSSRSGCSRGNLKRGDGYSMDHKEDARKTLFLVFFFPCFNGEMLVRKWFHELGKTNMRNICKFTMLWKYKNYEHGGLAPALTRVQGFQIKTWE